LAYHRNVDLVAALRQLALVSHSFHDWTTPALYRCVALLTPNNISYFSRTMRNSNMHGPKSAHVRTLQLDGFEDRLSARSAQNICTILHAVAPSLRRLFINLPLRYISPFQPNNEKFKRQPLRRALESLSPHNLTEFVSGRDELFVGQYGEGPLVWPDWAGLRRLALYNPVVDNVFLHALSNLPLLEVLVVVNAEAWADHVFSAPLPPSLRRVLLVYDSFDLWTVNLVQRWEAQFHSMGIKRGALVEVARIWPPPETEHVRTWVNHQIAIGELWEMADSRVDNGEQPDSRQA